MFDNLSIPLKAISADVNRAGWMRASTSGKGSRSPTRTRSLQQGREIGTADYGLADLLALAGNQVVDHFWFGQR